MTDQKIKYLRMYPVSRDHQSFICNSIHLSIYLSIHLSIHLSIFTSVYLSIHLSIQLSIYLSIHFSNEYYYSYIGLLRQKNWILRNFLMKLAKTFFGNLPFRFIAPRKKMILVQGKSLDILVFYTKSCGILFSNFL